MKDDSLKSTGLLVILDDPLALNSQINLLMIHTLPLSSYGLEQIPSAPLATPHQSSTVGTVRLNFQIK